MFTVLKTIKFIIAILEIALSCYGQGLFDRSRVTFQGHAFFDMVCRSCHTMHDRNRPLIFEPHRSNEELSKMQSLRLRF